MKVGMVLRGTAGTMALFLAVACSHAIRDGVAIVGQPTRSLGHTGPTTAAATTSLECGGKTYEVSTGTSTGTCSVLLVDGKASSVDCSDGNNGGHASCAAGCGATGGAGSCTVKSGP